MDWKDWFRYGESPYFSMFKCGINNIQLEEVTSYCSLLGIPLREKDINNYINGKWQYDFSQNKDILNPVIRPQSVTHKVVQGAASLQDFKQWDPSWIPTERRWFPCTADNMPMQKWGYKDGFTPTLYTRDEAKALAPTNLVGQNMLGQRFIVIDIDGVGHGVIDKEVIAWGEQFKNYTESWENPDKPGSFHLYFSCDRAIPVMHFNYAKLDFMGNQTNAAVYTKHKQSNHVPRIELTEEIFKDMMLYVKSRKERR